jgi:hypothetical protein
MNMRYAVADMQTDKNDDTNWRIFANVSSTTCAINKLYSHNGSLLLFDFNTNCNESRNFS